MAAGETAQTDFELLDLLRPSLIQAPLAGDEDAADQQRHEDVSHPPRRVVGEEAAHPALRWVSVPIGLGLVGSSAALLAGDATRAVELGCG